MKQINSQPYIPQYQWPQGARQGTLKFPKQIGQTSSVGGVSIFDPFLSATTRLVLDGAVSGGDNEVSASSVVVLSLDDAVSSLLVVSSSLSSCISPPFVSAIGGESKLGFRVCR